MKTRVHCLSSRSNAHPSATMKDLPPHLYCVSKRGALNNLLYEEDSPFVDNAHLQNTGGEHSAKLFTEAEEQGDDRIISARTLEQEQCTNSPSKQKSGLCLPMRYRRGSSGKACRGAYVRGWTPSLGMVTSELVLGTHRGPVLAP